MKFNRFMSLLLLSSALGIAAFAQNNQQTIDQEHHQAKLDEKADKSQADADKKARKALKSRKVKDAAKAQDKADKEQQKADSPR